MADRKKVINALGRCESYGYCEDRNCPYYENTNCLEMLRKDALELLEDDETQLIYRDEIIKAHEDEIERLNELLEEQEPIRPTVSVDTWICSKCGHTLESQELIDDKENPQVLIHEQYEYCPCCGRKVNWE